MVVAHRWLGLSMAAFLVVLGATGSLIAFNDELEAWISPELFRVAAPYAGAPLLDPFVVRDRVLASYPGAEANWVELALRPGRSVVVGLEPAPGAAAPPAADEVFADPYTGRVLGERTRGDLSQGAKNLMPFVYALHVSLALGDTGTWALGVVALLWSMDCVVGFCLTLPPRPVAPSSRRPWRHWSARWWPAWRIRWHATASKVVFDLHRATGLWPWAMLFVLAWSGVGFNLPAVYRPLMRVVDAEVAAVTVEGAIPRSSGGAPIGWALAHQAAREAMRDAADAHGFTVLRERALYFDAARARYEYRVLSTLDVGDKLGNTTLFLDAGSGALLHLELPTGRHAGNTLDAWLSSLHTAAWGGVAMQVVLSATGVGVVVLSATGVGVWWQRRRAARRARAGSAVRRARPLRR